MSQEDLLRTAVQLSTSLEALAALAAHLRVESEGLAVDPAVRDLLASVAGELLGEPAPVGPAAGSVIGMTRALLRQAVELVENPGRRAAWDQVDEGLLQGMGRLSMAIVGAFRAAESTLGGLGERLRSDGATFLDVGTGTGWLAIATAQAYPALAVTGLDMFEPALTIARSNVAAEAMGERVTLELQDMTTLDAEQAYDVIWLPLPFMTQAAVEASLDVCTRALRPGGWVLPGAFAGPPDPLSQLLIDLRTVRSGGHPWQSTELVATIASHGFIGAWEVPRTWNAPVRLYAGQLP
jgi:SAM-dependent methyltransferase